MCEDRSLIHSTATMKGDCKKYLLLSVAMKAMLIISFGVTGHNVMYSTLDLNVVYNVLCLIRPLRAEIKLSNNTFLTPG